MNSKATYLGLRQLPMDVLDKILSYCSASDMASLAMAWPDLEFPSPIIEAMKMSDSEDEDDFAASLNNLPSEVLMNIFKFLDYKALGRVAQVSRRFRALSYADPLWSKDARDCLVTNGKEKSFTSRTHHPIKARDKVRIARNWVKGYYSETKLLVMKNKFMPRLQLERDTLWVSWGNWIWAHPRSRHGDGTIGRTTTHVLKGHTDDVSRFLVKDGLVVSGGRDATLVGWDSTSGDFLFAKRYCHGGEVSAVDYLSHHNQIVSGSRDHTLKLWTLAASDIQQQPTFPGLVQTLNIGDRIWSLGASPCQSKIAIGSAGHGGIPALHLLDLEAGQPALQPMGSYVLKKGAGTLDIQWHTETTFLSCGYDTSARLWDTRSGNCVRTWIEPFDESIYCLSTDGNMSLVCGTARHGLARLWDMRHSKPVQMFYAKHARLGQSSPVYSVAFDSTSLYLALDQCLNLLSFAGLDNSRHLRRGCHPNWEY